MNSVHSLTSVTASQIIGEIVALPPSERAEVIRFASRFNTGGSLNGDELAALASRMVESRDLAEKDALWLEIERGFYGETKSG
jgi:hypothetical protein